MSASNLARVALEEIFLSSVSVIVSSLTQKSNDSFMGRPMGW